VEWGEITSTLEIIGVESSMGGEGRMVTVWLTSHPVIWGRGKRKEEERGEERSSNWRQYPPILLGSPGWALSGLKVEGAENQVDSMT
jgi:hypothetical protein